MLDEQKLRIIKSKKYLDWLVEFTENTHNKCWDDETAHLQRGTFTQRDMDNVNLFGAFVDYALEQSYKQYVVSLPHHKSVDFRFNIKLRNNYYELSVICYSCVRVIKKINQPEGKVVYIDEPISPKELKEREFIQYILVNKDLDVPKSVFAVHIAHACTVCAIRECERPAFKVWYNSNQKIIILDASKEKIEEMEKSSYGIRDTGHNNIPKNSLIAISLGVMPRAKASALTKGCTLHKD